MLANRQVLLLTYSHGDVDAGSMPVGDLVKSLIGWRRCLHLAESAVVRQRLVSRPLPADQQIELRIRAVRPGSLVVVLEQTAAQIPPIGGMAIGVLTLGSIWVATQRIVDRYLRSKRQRSPIDRIAVDLRKEVEPQDRRQSAHSEVQQHDATAFVEALDGSMQKATSPIGRSAGRITMSTDTGELPTISLGSIDRETIETPFAVGPATSEDSFAPAKVRIERINVRTGKAYVTVTEGEARGKSLNCAIVDPQFRRPGDAYTGALHRRMPLDVYMRQVELDASGTHIWEVTQDPPTDLFKRECDGTGN